MDDDDDLTFVMERRGAAGRAGTTKPERARGEQIAFFSDSEDDLEKQTTKKTKKRKTAATTAPSTTTKRAKTGGKSLVGRRKLPKAKKAADDSPETSDEESALLVETLPQYLQSRRRQCRDEQERGGGFKSPPRYDDIDGLAVTEELEERPHLPGVLPCRAYEDVPLMVALQPVAIIPASLGKFLKPYQIEGAEWLYRRYMRQRGGILGDDMGLGKTIQVIAFLTAAFGKTGDERDAKRMRKIRKHDETRFYPRILIVCPGTLMENWQSELNRWGWWHAYKYHGSSTSKDEAISAASSGRLEIMMTTYATYTKDEDIINQVEWDCVIADEFHQIKERKSLTTKAMMNVNALCRIGLSGTAIQNKYEELWTLLNWCNPGAVQSIAAWKRGICVPLKMGQSHDATMSQLAKSRKVAHDLVKHLLPRFFIRRTKALIADQLPKKSDRVVFCPLTETQVEAYSNFIDHELVHAIRDSSKPCYCGSGKKQGWCCVQEVEEFGEWKNQVFPALHTIQKMCNHLGLMVPAGEADPERHEKDLQKLQIALPDRWKDMYAHRDNIKMHANTEFCGKWKVLKKLLKLWYDNGDKVLVFSHSVRLLKMLSMLFKLNTSYNVSYLDGSMQLEERKQAVDDYNADPSQFVFLISTKAGGVGLNITSANKVVIMDPNWNPAYDLQAQDRAYRIGQTKDVEVFRLVSVGTVEEIVYARQIYKQQQANIGYNASVERRYFKGVQGEKDHKGEIFGLGNLFAEHEGHIKLRDIVNKTNIAETRAGVEIAGLDWEASQEDEDGLTPFGNDVKEDLGMSMLAAEIIDEPSHKRKIAKEVAKKDPVQAILASAGVEYTHENAEVIGTSKIETKISSRAQKAGNDIDYINEKAFARNTQSQADDRVYPQNNNRDQDTEDDEAIDFNDGLGKVHYKYRPNEDIRKRQFCTMAKMLGFDDVTEFALVVEGWTQEQRRDCLEKFYKDRRAALAAEKKV